MKPDKVSIQGSLGVMSLEVILSCAQITSSLKCNSMGKPNAAISSGLKFQKYTFLLMTISNIPVYS